MAFTSFLELAEGRYSLRKYSDRPVPQAVLDNILRAGRAAPTAKNLQPQRIFVLQSPAAMEKLRSVTRYTFHAPLALLICSDTETAWVGQLDGHSTAETDAVIATTQMMLEAFDQGVGSCWVRGFDWREVRRVYELPERLLPVAVLTLGYPAEGAGPAPGWHDKRRGLEETVTYL